MESNAQISGPKNLQWKKGKKVKSDDNFHFHFICFDS